MSQQPTSPAPAEPSPQSSSVPASTLPAPADLNDSSLYNNRILSLLQFNLRVLDQVRDESHPLLERLKFLIIFSSNLDEFFEVRITDLVSSARSGQARLGADGLLPQEVLAEVSRITHEAVDEQYRLLNEVLIPELAKEKIFFLPRDQWTDVQQEWIRQYFLEQVQPVLTPIALDQSHPFPLLGNKSLNFIVSLDGKDAFGRQTNLAIIPAPRALPRVIQLPSDICEEGHHFVFLSSIIHDNASSLFPGMTATGCYQFRITRNADLHLDESEVEDLQVALKGELLSRRYGTAMRLEVADNCPEELQEYLLKKTELTHNELYKVKGPVNLARFFGITMLDRPRLQYPPFLPAMPAFLKKHDNLFDALSQRDILLFHPYESFQPVVSLLSQAARDPDVLAIKQTLYRTEDNSEIIQALVDAARNGKEVTVVIELRARFDEENNIEDAELLQKAGAIVVYGIVGFKTHCKMIMVVRREGNQLKRYVQLGTGNYHAGNARIYTDYSLMTANPEICDDVHKIFRQLTGMGKAARLKQLYHAPFTLHKQVLDCIERETTHARQGKPASIRIKVNGLTDKLTIQALYRASQAGVRVDLVVRGICCLKPGIPGVSENIRVRSLVGRFLEHARVYCFGNDKEPAVYLASADLMERNLFSRVEILFPVHEKKLKQRVIRECFDYAFKDNCYAWELDADGQWHRARHDEQPPFSAQACLLEELAQ